MSTKWNYLDELNEYYDDQPLPMPKPRNKPRAKRAEVVSQLVEAADDTRHGFNPSFGSKSAEKFNVSRHEREWILQYLSGFYEDHLITDVVKPVKGGKEATVYCCLAGPELGVALVAAKLYRPSMFRSLRNDSLYRIGRGVQDEQGKNVYKRREALAFSQGTRFGKDLRHMAWLGNEVETLRLLHAAGADVPRVYGVNDNAILMDYYGEADMAAPVLASVRLSGREARPLFDRIVHNIDLMLAHRRIHGDLSAHNILYWQGNIHLIDYPQAVDPYVNPYAEEIFRRDVQRVCEYFSRYGIAASAVSLATEIWERRVEE